MSSAKKPKATTQGMSVDELLNRSDSSDDDEEMMKLLNLTAGASKPKEAVPVGGGPRTAA